MVKFLSRRFFTSILTLFLMSVAIFLLTECAPGNIAVATLGNTITEQQEASFNAQNGLDQTLGTRYWRWMFGSDWEAERMVGGDLVRDIDPEADRISWWAVDSDGVRYQVFTNVEQEAGEDGERAVTYMRRFIQTDGTIAEEELPDSLWQTDETGARVVWGVDGGNRVAKWIEGSQSEATYKSATGWIIVPGAPDAYIPLGRGILRGDFGVSFKDRRPVVEVLPRRLLNTLFLAASAFIIVMPVALVLGLFAGLNEGGVIDRVFSISSLVATATPEFASGIFLILIFAQWLNWVPGAVVVTDDTALFRNPAMLVLPIATLTLLELGYVLRITRSSMVEVMRTNYIRTAVLKGLPRNRIIFKHALRNALMAPITIITLHINWLVGGIVIVETLFAFPGVGRYVLDSALFKDFPALGASALVLVIIAILSQLLADFIYTYLNPRIRFS